MTPKPFVLLCALLFSSGQAVQAAEITVSAAASLGDAFKAIASQYQQTYPGSSVRLNTASSGTLLQQIDKGAPVDVLAVADQTTMDQAADKKLLQAGSRHNFTANRLVLIVPHNSPLQLRSLNDLNQPGIKRIALGHPDSVPAGRYSQAALNQAQLWSVLRPKYIHTQNVRQALDYVARGQVQAGFVYASDAAQMRNKVKVVLTVPTPQPIVYPIARLSRSKNPAEADRFVRYVLSAPAQAILQKYGFQSMPTKPATLDQTPTLKPI